MSATTRALSIPEIVTRVFVFLPEPDCWTAARVSVLWWDAAQYAAFLTRERVCTDPDASLLSLAEAVQFGPRAARPAVRHVNLSTLNRFRQRGTLAEDLSLYVTDHPIHQVLEVCWSIVSVALYGLGADSSLSDLIRWVRVYLGKNVTWIRLACTDLDLSTFKLNFPFVGLRHLHLTGRSSAWSGMLHSFPQSSNGLGFSRPAAADLPPSLHLTSLTLTNVGLVGAGGFTRFDPRAPIPGLPTEALTWLLSAAHGGSPARADDGPTQDNHGLRELCYRFDDLRSAKNTRLSPEAIAAIADGAPQLELVELWLKPENVINDLDAVFALLDMHNLTRLELGVFVALDRVVGGQGRLDELKVELAEAVDELDEGRRAKVVLLN